MPAAPGIAKVPAVSIGAPRCAVLLLDTEVVPAHGTMPQPIVTVTLAPLPITTSANVMAPTTTRMLIRR